MDALCQAVENLRTRLEDLRRHSLKELPTRTILIDPVLRALGWDVEDPNEVELEYGAIAGKTVDYALKINKKPVVLVEAKALDDALDDEKAIAQAVGYAANEGVDWCVLTNGVKWRVYRSAEKRPAPEKLMFEVSLDPRDSEGMTVQDIARQLSRISRTQVADGTLDAVGKRVFADGKVRKALDALMREPPRSLLNVVRAKTGDPDLTPSQVRESLGRVWTAPSPGVELSPPEKPSGRSAGARKAWETRRGQQRQAVYDEAHHTADKPQEVLELYRAIDRVCLNLDPDRIQKRFTAQYVGYWRGEYTFCRIWWSRFQLIVSVRLDYQRLANPPSFARDVTRVVHEWSGGTVRMTISDLSQIDAAAALIRQSFESRR